MSSDPRLAAGSIASTHAAEIIEQDATLTRYHARRVALDEALAAFNESCIEAGFNPVRIIIAEEDAAKLTTSPRQMAAQSGGEHLDMVGTTGPTGKIGHTEKR